MKKLFLIIGVAALLATTSCTTPAQRTAFNTIFSVEQTATLAVDDYFTLVIKGVLTTNSVPAVANSYNTLQVAGQLAASASQLGTNGLAPASLVLEAANLGAIIDNAKQTNKK